ACTGSSCRPSTEWTPARERRRLSWTSWTSSPRRQISRACWCRCAWPTAWSSSAATAMCFTSSSSQPTRAAAPRPSTTSLVTSTSSSRSPPGARRRSHSRSSRCASATSTRCSPRRPSSPGTSSAAPTARTGSASTRPTSIHRPGSLLSHFPSGSFGDGGYLDNKPFSHAIDALVTRHAEVPVERKLIYVEPAPDHPEDTAPLRRQPDAIENSLAALVEIPGYETIRGDLQTVLERMVSALGIVTLALIVVGLSMDRRARSMRFVATRRRTSSGIARPILACELVESPADVRAIVGDVQSPDRSTMATIQKIDFVFIGLYWVLFTGLAVLMARNT